MRFLLRVVLVALALFYAFPLIAGIKFSGDILGTIVTSLVFNVIYFGFEWLMRVVAVAINITTFGLGMIITSGLRFCVGLVAPAIALYATALLMPQFLHIHPLLPQAIVAGLVLGGILWVTAAENKKR